MKDYAARGMAFTVAAIVLIVGFVLDGQREREIAALRAEIDANFEVQQVGINLLGEAVITGSKALRAAQEALDKMVAIQQFLVDRALEDPVVWKLDPLPRVDTNVFEYWDLSDGISGGGDLSERWGPKYSPGTNYNTFDQP